MKIKLYPVGDEASLSEIKKLVDQLELNVILGNISAAEIDIKDLGYHVLWLTKYYKLIPCNNL